MKKNTLYNNNPDVEPSKAGVSDKRGREIFINTNEQIVIIESLVRIFTNWGKVDIVVLQVNRGPCPSDSGEIVVDK